MSSILKALRKLEEEKAALGEGRVDLARDILKRAAPQRNSSVPLALMIAFFTVLTLALVVGAWLVLDAPAGIETAKVVVPGESQPVIAPSVVPAGPVARQSPVGQTQVEASPIEKKSLDRVVVAGGPSEETPVEKTSQLKTPEPDIEIVEMNNNAIPALEITPEEIPVAKQPIGVEEKRPVSQKLTPVDENIVDSEAPAETLTARSDPAMPEDHTELALPSGAQQALEAEPVVADMPLPADLPELQISAIAYRSAPGERLAVVNDLPVMEGTSIEGVQILEIQEQGVRFSWQGIEFVLPLAEENPQD